MDPKLAFGYDYFYVMRTLQLSSSKGADIIADAATRLLLSLWGFNFIEVDEASNKFLDDAEKKNIPDFEMCFDRIISYVKKEKLTTERLLIQTVAIAYMDSEINKDEASFIKMISDALDLRPSDLKSLVEQGAQLAEGLNYFGDIYLHHKNK